MKKLILLLALFGSINAISQIDLESPSDDFELTDVVHIATGKSNDVKTAYKFTINASYLRNFEFGIEHKLGKSFSVVGGLNSSIWNFTTTSLMDSIIIFQTSQTILSSSLNAGLRYYPHQARQIESGYGNNINGLYFASGARHVLYYSDENFKPKNSTSFYVGTGLQSRFLKHGIVDFALNGNFNLDDDNKLRFYLGTSVRIGLVSSKGYRINDFRNEKCNILKCFEEQRSMFKLPLSDLVALSTRSFGNAEYQYGFLNPSLGYEHKLNGVGISMDHLLSVPFSANFRSRNSGITPTSVRVAVQYKNRIKWYFLKKRQIAAGKSANNLLGMYASTLLTVNTSRTSLSSGDFISRGNSLLYGATLGYQFRIFKNLYCDFYGEYWAQRISTIWNPANPIGPVSRIDNFNKFNLGIEIGISF